MARSVSLFTLILLSFLSVSAIVALPTGPVPGKPSPAKRPVAAKVPAPASKLRAVGKAVAAAKGVAAARNGKSPNLPIFSPASVAVFKPYSYYAAAAYCKPDAIKSWKCGTNCDANKGFQVIDRGGDGNAVQYWFVGIDPKLQQVIVSHQGTNPTQLLSVLTDLNFPPEPLDKKMFPNMPADVRVHRGFAAAQASTAAPVLAAVKKALAQSKFKEVTIVGHSLGGAIALLDAVYLPQNVPGVTFRTVTYGQPRVGNKAFATWVDKNIVKLDRINNKDDMVPIVPGRRLGFTHTKGEKHIQDDGTWLVCPGGDNDDIRCSTGDVKTIIEGNVIHHLGKYDGVWIGTVGSC